MLKEANKIHFIGIGGIGVSTLAQISNDQGKTATGSDIEDSDHIHQLQKEGIKVSIGHKAENIDKDHDLIVYSYAIEKENPELTRARELGIPTITYPEAVGEFSQDYYTVSITGTHGKSTTTSMMAILAMDAGLDPTIILGTKLKEMGDKNYRIGTKPSINGKKLLIVEACEFRNAFLYYKTDVLAVINVDSDHLDFFKTQENYIEAFKKACNQVPKDGLIIVDSDDKWSRGIWTKADAPFLKITSKPNKYATCNKSYLLEGRTLTPNKTRIKVETHKYEKEKTVSPKPKIKPPVPGKFNIRNSAFTAVIGQYLGLTDEQIEKGITKYKGSWRRMELKTTSLNEIKFYDDYAHLPAEIDLTLEAIRDEYPDKKILAVFQPHQFVRIKLLLKEFGAAFSHVDGVLIPDILRNRDTKEQMAMIGTPELLDEIRKNHDNVNHTTDIPDTAKWIKTHEKEYDIIIAMGSGNIKKLYKHL